MKAKSSIGHYLQREGNKDDQVLMANFYSEGGELSFAKGIRKIGRINPALAKRMKVNRYEDLFEDFMQYSELKGVKTPSQFKKAMAVLLGQRTDEQYVNSWSSMVKRLTENLLETDHAKRSLSKEPQQLGTGEKRAYKNTIIPSKQYSYAHYYRELFVYDIDGKKVILRKGRDGGYRRFNTGKRYSPE